MKGRQIHYEPEELAWIERHKEMPREQMWRRFCFIFQRDDVSFAAMKGLCGRKGWLTGRDGCFAAGQEPHNKGRKGYAAPGSEKGWFKKGGTPHNTNYLGHERVSKDGYVEISVDRPNKHTGYERSYVLKHVWLWEQANGPVPAGHALKCLDGNRQNCDPSNWEAVPRALLPRLSGRWHMPYDAAPAELKPTLLAIAKLEHAARSARQVAR